MKRSLALVLVVLSACVALPAMACTGSGNAQARLESFASGLHSLRGDFQQTLKNAAGQATQTSSGKVALEAPNRFRWQTLTPDKQLIVADGQRVWMYEPDLEQVTVRPQSAAQAHSPLALLTHVADLNKDFTCTELGDHSGLAWLYLKPRAQNAGFNYAELGFDAKGLRAMVFKDRVGNLTQLTFSNWQRNARLGSSVFHFKPPKDADVIRALDTPQPAMPGAAAH